MKSGKKVGRSSDLSNALALMLYLKKNTLKFIV